MTGARSLVLLATAACSFHVNTAQSGDAPPFADAPAADAPNQTDAPVPMVTFVRSTSSASSAWNSGVGSFTLTLAATPAAGDLLAVYLTYDGRVNLTGITDNAGNTYTMVDSISDNGNQQNAVTAYAFVITPPTRVTASYDNNGCCSAMIVHELHGANATTPLDASTGRFQNNAGSSTDAVSTGTAMTHVGLDYVFAATSNSSNSGGMVIHAGTGETSRETLVPNMGNPTSSEDRVASAPAAVASTFTFSTAGNALTLEMAFRP